ncbi:Transcription factor tcp10 [Dispira simplex]|nr:Transcription factor tcp10 [Dispira simplex]
MAGSSSPSPSSPLTKEGEPLTPRSLTRQRLNALRERVRHQNLRAFVALETLTQVSPPVKEPSTVPQSPPHLTESTHKKIDPLPTDVGTTHSPVTSNGALSPERVIIPTPRPYSKWLPLADRKGYLCATASPATPFFRPLAPGNHTTRPCVQFTPLPISKPRGVGTENGPTSTLGTYYLEDPTVTPPVNDAPRRVRFQSPSQTTQTMVELPTQPHSLALANPNGTPLPTDWVTHQPASQPHPSVVTLQTPEFFRMPSTTEEPAPHLSQRARYKAEDRSPPSHLPAMDITTKGSTNTVAITSVAVPASQHRQTLSNPPQHVEQRLQRRREVYHERQEILELQTQVDQLKSLLQMKTHQAQTAQQQLRRSLTELADQNTELLETLYEQRAYVDLLVEENRSLKGQLATRVSSVTSASAPAVVSDTGQSEPGDPTSITHSPTTTTNCHPIMTNSDHWQRQRQLLDRVAHTAGLNQSLPWTSEKPFNNGKYQRIWANGSTLTAYPDNNVKWVSPDATSTLLYFNNGDTQVTYTLTNKVVYTYAKDALRHTTSDAMVYELWEYLNLPGVTEKWYPDGRRLRTEANGATTWVSR